MSIAAVLVLVLSAGVLALVIWFETNSRRNEVRIKQPSKAAPPIGTVRKGSEVQGQGAKKAA